MSLFGRGFSLGLRVLLLTGVIAILITTPATSNSYKEKDNRDPFESTNRLVFSFNVGLDQLVLEPVSIAYRDLMPNELKTPINNLLDTYKCHSALFTLYYRATLIMQTERLLVSLLASLLFYWETHFLIKIFYMKTVDKLLQFGLKIHDLI